MTSSCIHVDWPHTPVTLLATSRLPLRDRQTTMSGLLKLTLDTVTETIMLRDKRVKQRVMHPRRLSYCKFQILSAKLHYKDTGYGHVVQHHQRTSSQQVVQHVRSRLNLLYSILLSTCNYHACTGRGGCLDNKRA